MQLGSSLLRLCIASLIIVNLNCKKDDLPVVPPVPPAVDTTNHNFTWSMFEFGGNVHYNILYDVVARNDSDIWVVGEMYWNDSTCNALHWNGTDWEAKPILFSGRLSGGIRFPALRAVVSLGPGKIFATTGELGAWVDGEKVTMDTAMVPALQGTVVKLFALSPKNIYAVGERGSIAHYDGTKWSKMSSGTTIRLLDVYGTSDGKTLWASGYDTSSILLKYDGIRWQKIWEHNPGAPLMPFYTLVTGVFATKNNLWLSGDAGIYKSPLSSDTSLVEKQPIDPIRGSHAIRGTPTGNSIAVVYEDGIIWHYNGASWHQVHTLSFNQDFYAVAVTQHTIVAVGADYFTGQALIYLGTH
jgi:hypothetical protein